MLVRHCGDARFVWNLALEQANCYRAGRPSPGAAERSRQLAEARAGTWLGDGSSSVQQQALRDFDQAMRNTGGPARIAIPGGASRGSTRASACAT